MASGNIKIWFLWAISAREGGGGVVILGAEGKRWRGDCLITNKFAGNLLSHAFQCLVTFSSCFHSALSLALSLSSLCLHI